MKTFDEVPHTNDFFVSTEKSLLDQRWLITHLLAQKWTECWTHERLAGAIAHSLTFGVFHRQYAEMEEGSPLGSVTSQVGFARVITDGHTYSMVCDVVIQESYRKRGLAKFLMGVIVTHPEVKKTVSLLRTKDAQKLYAQFGYLEVAAMRRIPLPSCTS